MTSRRLSISPDVLYSLAMRTSSNIVSASTYDELLSYVGRVDVVVEVECNIVQKSRDVYIVTLIPAICRNCGYTTVTVSGSRCPRCRNILEPTGVPIQFKIRKARAILRDNYMIDVVLVDSACNVKGGRTRLRGRPALVSISRSDLVTKLVLYAIEAAEARRNVKANDNPLLRSVLSVQDWRRRLEILLEHVADYAGIVGLRPAILLLLCVVSGAHGPKPFRDDLEEPRRKRWWIHAAVLGNPGTGKSTLSSMLRNIVPHGKCILLSSGQAATLAGLGISAYAGEVTEGPFLLLDGGPEDFGVLIIEEAHTLPDRLINEIKDWTERGELTVAKGTVGIAGGLCRVATVLVANWRTMIYTGPESIPDFLRDQAMCDRIDIIVITAEDKEISSKILDILTRQEGVAVASADIIQDYILCARRYTPRVVNFDEIKRRVEEYATSLAVDFRSAGLYRSETRLKLSILRVAVALAKLSFTDITPDHVTYAAKLLETQLDYLAQSTLDSYSGYMQIFESLHRIEPSRSTVRNVAYMYMLHAGEFTVDNVVNHVCIELERNYYRCDRDYVRKIVEEYIDELHNSGRLLKVGYGRYRLL